MNINNTKQYIKARQINFNNKKENFFFRDNLGKNRFFSIKKKKKDIFKIYKLNYYLKNKSKKHITL
jgi:hypothetical protein